MSTSDRLRAFKTRENASQGFAEALRAVFGDKTKVPTLDAATEAQQGQKGTPLAKAFKTFRDADANWRGTIR